MKKEAYEPPKQSGFGQLFDSIFVMALVAVTLLASLYITILSAEDGSEAADAAPVVNTIAGTPEVEKIKAERFAALGWSEADVQERQLAIASKSYEINWLMTIITAIVVIGYFVFLVKVSDRELRQVIDERFGPGGQQ